MTTARTIYLVRHAKAGDRSSWHGDDRDRPLSPAGEVQAQAIAQRLGGVGVSVLLSSPFARCRQTLGPLADAVGATVLDDKRLAEGTPVEDVLELIASVPDGAVLCSHGDVVPDVIAALQRRGCVVTTAPDWRKGTVWMITADPERGCTAAVEPPPVAPRPDH